MCGAPKQGGSLAGIDLTTQTVIQGSVWHDGAPVAGAFVRLLDSTDEFTAEVVASPEGEFRFFAAPGDWKVRALAPVGKGLTITAGLFNSLIGYESLYAKDNANYTRSWIADNTPYMMFGVNAKYPVSDNLTVTAFIINGYYHLSNPNDQPSYGGQWAYKATPRLTLTQTLYGGPDQTNTAFEFWRFYANHIVEWKGEDLTLVASYDIGTENIANRQGSPRAFVTGGNVVARWHVTGPWAVAVRPEFYWDRNGRWTGSEQFVKAVTSTVEYRFPYRRTNTILRLEHRWDESTGAGGGFFRRGEIQPGVLSLTPNQHLVLLGILWTFDSP